MMKKIIQISILVILVMLCGICVWFSIKFDWFERSSLTCEPPPDWFSKSDLVGTWAVLGDGIDDKLIIRPDGTYKQLVKITQKDTNEIIEYESDWQTWSLEFGRGEGIPYLYLQGYTNCGAYASYGYDVDCKSLIGNVIGWSDCCDEKPRESSSGETALNILGPPSYREPTGTMSDVQLIRFGDCEMNAWHYFYQVGE